MAEKVTELFIVLGPRLRRMVASIGVAPDEVDDVLADAFVVCWSRLVSLPPTWDERAAWVYEVTRRTALFARTKRARRGALLVRLAQQGTSRFTTVDQYPHLESDGVNALLEQLPAAQQEVVRLLVVDDLDPTAIGERLGISPSAVASRLHRARHQMREMLSDDEGLT